MAFKTSFYRDVHEVRLLEKVTSLTERKMKKKTSLSNAKHRNESNECD